MAKGEMGQKQIYVYAHSRTSKCIILEKLTASSLSSISVEMADQQVKCSQPLAIGEAQSNLQRNTVVHSLDGENDKD